MKILKIILVALSIAGLITFSIGCSSEPDEAETTGYQTVTAQRGNLTVDITASGNLALSYTAEPSFQIAGYVEEVMVEAGDTVEEGQILAKMDADTLEEAVATTERALKTAEANVTTAEIDLESATNSLTALTNPYPFLTFPWFLPDTLEAVRIAQVYIKDAQNELALHLAGESADMGETKDKLIQAQEKLVIAEDKLDWGLGQGVVPSNESYWTIRAAQIAMEKAQLSLDKYEVSLDTAVDNLNDARDELEKATVRAPFSGFITTVNVEGGDEVYKGTVVAQVADPTKFEAEILVNEMDIAQVKLDGDATVQVSAMSELSLPAKVTHISPTATITSGVVNYTVKVELESLEALMQEQQAAMQEAAEKLLQGELPEYLQQAIEEGSLTQEQVEEMMQQMQQTEGWQQEQAPTILSESFQLREGLTVTVSIIVDKATDVLLVPNGAITSQGGQSYIQIMSSDGTIEERAVTTGISNWQYTELTEGLSEGEEVVVPQGTTIPTTQQGPPHGMMIPGMMGPR